MNKGTEIIGTYVIGKLWRFMLLEKAADDTYTYTLSIGYNGLNLEDLKKIYISLQGVKADILEKINLSPLKTKNDNFYSSIEQ